MTHFLVFFFGPVFASQCSSNLTPSVNTHFSDSTLLHVSGSACCHETTDPSRAASFQECCSRCETSSECTGWTWSVKDQRCYLVQARPNLTLLAIPAPDKISGYITRSKSSDAPADLSIPAFIDPQRVIMKNRFEFPELLNYQQPQGMGVVLGVGRGAFALNVLSKWKGGLYLVDPYIHYHTGYDDVENFSDKEHQLIFEQLRNEIHRFEFRYTFIRDFSYTFADFWRKKETIPAPTFVYVDANHRYEAVNSDLRRWWPLLASGGIMAGSWYTDQEGSGVKQAVNEFFSEIGLHQSLYFSLDKPYPNWLIFKPIGDNISETINIKQLFDQ